MARQELHAALTPLRHVHAANEFVRIRTSFQPLPQLRDAPHMKTLLFLLILVSPVFGEAAWTHQSAEGQDGGLAADYVFYKTTMPKAGDHIMGVHKVRAVYAYGHPRQEIVIAEYEYKNGLHVTISKANGGELDTLSRGGDGKTEVIREYTLECEGKRGAMARLKITKPLTLEQQNGLYNLSVLMMLERWPFKSR